jgi:hypothetical protein
MIDKQRSRSFPWLLLVAIVVVLGVGGIVAYPFLKAKPTSHQASEPQMLAEVPEATTEEVHQLCGACHAYPPADTFPRSAWLKEVKQGYDFLHKDPGYRLEYPALESVVRYYEKRAPGTLPPLVATPSPHPCPAQFDRQAHRAAGGRESPGVTHVSLVHLFRKDKLDILLCDALSKEVAVLSPYESPPKWNVIARGFSCAHAEVVDLNGDGTNDVLLACLGSFSATDDRVGSVVLLKGARDGTFSSIVLLDGVGRVADVRAANFMSSGKLDLVVAEFGWHETGSILLLENQTTDWARPKFVPRLLDNRHGTTHVPVADLNGDGKPDFVAAISQEHETVVAFINEGEGRFRKETVYTAPHPTWGINSVQLVDLDGDGDLDALMSNGDSLDPPYLVKPYHGVSWLENQGQYPFVPHRLADSYGAGSPVVADFSGSGRLDVAFVSFLPAKYFPERTEKKLESVVLLEQVSPGKFVRHSLEAGLCDHLTCAAGDLDGDGLPELVIGNFMFSGNADDGVTIWRNTTRKARPKP